MFYRKEDGRFSFGRTVITVHARAHLSDAEVIAGLERHHQGDWGDLTDRDKRQNDEALAEGRRLLSAYTTPQGVNFWIITEEDRSVTTILLPNDY
jgi:hypothetical protein